MNTSNTNFRNVIKNMHIVQSVINSNVFLIYINRTQELTWHQGNTPRFGLKWKAIREAGHSNRCSKNMLDVPKALRQTVVACAFAAGDTCNNLKTGLMRFRQQVADLQSCTWKSHNIRLFGDYEYLCRLESDKPFKNINYIQIMDQCANVLFIFT